jgi:hypothetical protein
MARNVMVFNNPTLKVAASQAGLTTGTAYECQVTSAVIATNPVMNTIPATGCAGASQSPGSPAYQLDIAWLQDWTTAGGGGLSGWAWANKGLAMWVEIVPDKIGAPTVKAQGQVWVVPGQFGGVFGDGSAGPASATWPFVNAPTITPATVELADAEQADADDLVSA